MMWQTTRTFTLTWATYKILWIWFMLVCTHWSFCFCIWFLVPTHHLDVDLGLSGDEGVVLCLENVQVHAQESKKKESFPGLVYSCLLPLSILLHCL